MKKTQFNAAELAEITAIQEQRSITRKSAIRVFEKDGRRLNLTNANKKAAPVAKPATTNPMPITVAAKAAPATTALPDVKSRAAKKTAGPGNLQTDSDERLEGIIGQSLFAKLVAAKGQFDGVLTQAEIEQIDATGLAPWSKDPKPNDETNKQPEAPKPPVPSTPAGDARKEGIRLFALAGKPKKEDFIHVYGEMGAKWTWVARAKAVGLNTPEEAAAQFQKMRAGKPGQFVKAEPQPEKK